MATIINGDCLEVLRGMPDNSIDAVVCDPPYGLSNTSPDKVTETIVRWASGDREYVPAGRGFMSQEWDAFVPPPAVWDECYRVLKPGGHMAVFSGTRTVDLMTLGIRLAGMEIRESIMWVYGSGFPKSHDVGKSTGDPKWSGFGTALKPAVEPIILARKPFKGTVANCAREWGTGALNIDACRIGIDQTEREVIDKRSGSNTKADGWGFQPTGQTFKSHVQGRFPANVVLDPECAGLLDQQSGTSKSKKADRGVDGGGFRLDGFTTAEDLRRAAERGEKTPTGRDAAATYQRYLASFENNNTRGHNDEGGASRFFHVAETLDTLDAPFKYCAKAPKRERPTVPQPVLRLRDDLTTEQADLVRARLQEAGVELQ